MVYALSLENVLIAGTSSPKHLTQISQNLVDLLLKAKSMSISMGKTMPIMKTITMGITTSITTTT